MYNFSLLRKRKRFGFEVKDTNMRTSKRMYQLGCTQGQEWSAVGRATYCMYTWVDGCLLGPISVSLGTDWQVPRMLLCQPLPVSPCLKERCSPNSSASCSHVSPTRSGRVKPPGFDFSLSPCAHLFSCLSEFGFCTCGWTGRPVLQCMGTRIKTGHLFPGLQCKGLITFQNNWSYKLMGHLKC